MIVLFLNDMRASNVENIQPRFRADTKEELLAFLEAETVEGYRDEQWGKTYRKDGPLEWMNPPWTQDERLHFQDAGTEDDWVLRARNQYNEQVMGVPVVPV